MEKFAGASTAPHHHPRKHLKPPLINRGTFIRTVAIDSACRNFLNEAGEGCQIVSLGAGFDTRFFRLSSTGQFKYFEVDFDSVMTTKQSIITADTQMSQIQSNNQMFLIGCDLNEPEKFKSLLKAHPSFNPTSPTLFIAECLFMYLSRESARELITFAANECKDCSFVAFDPVVSEDSFSRVMIENLEMRGVDGGNLSSFHTYTEAFNRHFTSIKALTMLQLEQERTFISENDAQLMKQKAALDEYEEWSLIANHYCFLLARK